MNLLLRKAREMSKLELEMSIIQSIKEFA